MKLSMITHARRKKRREKVPSQNPCHSVYNTYIYSHIVYIAHAADYISYRI